MKPPIANKLPKELVQHGDTRIDNYYWMKLSENQKNAKTPDAHTQDVLDYLNAENKYKDFVLKDTEELQEKLFEEIKARIKQTDMSVPYKSNGYYYITRYEEGKEYPIHSRKKENLEADEEIMLDVNVLAEGYSFYQLGGKAVSPDNKLLSYSEDTLSRRIYTIRFKSLVDGTMLDDSIENTTGSVVWANDNKTVFYTRKDEALRSYKIYKHIIGTSTDEDIEIFHERDETFSTFVYKTKSKKYIVIGSWATLSQEYRILNADNPNGNFEIFQPRQDKLEYSISHFEDNWYIRTNKDGAINFKLMKTNLENTSIQNWVDVIPHDKDVFFGGIDMFKDFMALSLREKGNTTIKIRNKSGDEHYIKFDEEAYSVWTSVNLDFETELLRIGFTSMTTPNSTFDYDIKSRKMKLLKQQEVVGDFNPTDYQSEKIMVTSRDGVEVPLSLVYKKGFVKDGKQPILLYGYGSYGNSTDPYFSSVRLSLLDRGFAFAIAHIRGGKEMGRMWYEDGKFLKKKNTFYDFIDCGKYLVEQGYTSPKHLYAMGGSAGGLLMGAVMNMAPDLWNGVVAAVPFVDVTTTMLDESIPLTTGEFSEWGNPKDKKYYDYIKSYSPYDNVVRQNYPATLITTGYFDSQVQYWEPAKWISKLRDYKTDNNPLIMHCDMEVGHGGASGRFARYKEVAMEYAFLLMLEEQIY